MNLTLTPAVLFTFGGFFRHFGLPDWVRLPTLQRGCFVSHAPPLCPFASNGQVRNCCRLNPRKVRAAAARDINQAIVEQSKSFWFRSAKVCSGVCGCVGRVRV